MKKLNKEQQAQHEALETPEIDIDTFESLPMQVEN